MQKRIYLDSVTIIYLLEKIQPRNPLCFPFYALLTHSILHMPLREDVKLSLQATSS
jgi:hypothetical protein